VRAPIWVRIGGNDTNFSVEISAITESVPSRLELYAKSLRGSKDAKSVPSPIGKVAITTQVAQQMKIVVQIVAKSNAGFDKVAACNDSHGRPIMEQFVGLDVSQHRSDHQCQERRDEVVGEVPCHRGKCAAAAPSQPTEQETQ
jgi:hypothetical protein